MLQILLVPLTTHGVVEYIDSLSADLKSKLESTGLRVDVQVWPNSLRVPIKCFEWSRLQYHASCVIKYLRDVFQQVSVLGKIFIVGVGYLDGYEHGLNFVFGEADYLLKIAVVFTKRLRPEFYGEKPNYNLYYERLLKEVLHELGHLLGLEHCRNPHCVMRFSNSILEVDEKGSYFCENCRVQLQSYISNTK